MNILRDALIIASVCVLNGCTDLTAVGGNDRFGCQAPPGVQCASISGVYANALRNNLPGQHRAVGTVPAISPSLGSMRPSADTAAGLYESAHVIRMWVKPWEDADHDLHDETFVYMQVEPQRWKVEAAEQRNRETFLRARVAALAAEPRRAAAPKAGASIRNSPAPANSLAPGADKQAALSR
ncbi:hypothetical protein E4L96_20020 [Massilia arenosa]|uniref:Conjugal transfer protein TraV n=1 Tax=Zemynaea arenosa TaxID=2561931 RepID=A0A4Y9S066_9BURK|nr:TraV family lipoprotein [Massilia arenosa]TFW13385.1 hypothetical protein E4L96_20020 [Massilia arenosa]